MRLPIVELLICWLLALVAAGQAQAAFPRALDLEHPARMHVRVDVVESIRYESRVDVDVQDFDGDGTAEFVCSHDVDNPVIRASIEAFESSARGWTLIWQHPLEHAARLQRSWGRDLDGDGDPDLVVQCWDSLGCWIEVWAFDGNRLFTGPRQLRATAHAIDYAPGTSLARPPIEAGLP